MTATTFTCISRSRFRNNGRPPKSHGTKTGSQKPHASFSQQGYANVSLRKCPALTRTATQGWPTATLTILQTKRQVCTQLSLTAEVATASGVPEEPVLCVLQTQRPLEPGALLGGLVQVQQAPHHEGIVFQEAPAGWVTRGTGEKGRLRTGLGICRRHAFHTFSLLVRNTHPPASPMATVSPFPKRVKGSTSSQCAHGEGVTDGSIEGEEQELASHKEVASWSVQPPTCVPQFLPSQHSTLASGGHWPRQTCAA